MHTCQITHSNNSDTIDLRTTLGKKKKWSKNASELQTPWNSILDCRKHFQTGSELRNRVRYLVRTFSLMKLQKVHQFLDSQNLSPEEWINYLVWPLYITSYWISLIIPFTEP